MRLGFRSLVVPYAESIEFGGARSISIPTPLVAALARPPF